MNCNWTSSFNSSQKLEDLQSARDRDQIYYNDQISKLQQEIQRNKQVSMTSLTFLWRSEENVWVMDLITENYILSKVYGL
jgi:hypothetical protein